MLGRLIQTAASYGKSNAALESATEESHTRNLLYGHSQHVYPLAQSPPSSPFAGPTTFRPGSFDDRGGLELEEKDIRILIAQDAVGGEEKATILFDSNTVTAQRVSHSRHASTTQAGQTSPVSKDWRSSLHGNEGDVPFESSLPFRNRSSTISGTPTTWTRPVRDAGTREEAFLECMFGVTTSTKSTSTTKMHLVPGTIKPPQQTTSRSNMTPDEIDQQNRRTPLMRSRTSVLASRSPAPTFPGLDIGVHAQDAVLITRLFSVAPPESVSTASKAADETTIKSSNVAANTQVDVPASPIEAGQQAKKPKLIERKVPAYAIGLILHLPRVNDSRSSSIRPASRSAHTHTLSSASSSYGSDMQNSWTFLNAIPESLASSRSQTDEPDRRVDIIVNNWDVVLRAISSLESTASAVISEQLEHVLDQAVGPVPKTPKEKSMQRINQRIISITDATTIAKRQPLRQAAKHMIGRVCYALRIPRVVTGMGFAAGHWSDETRMLYRICGRRQQNFFLFNLLTAFLGNHTQWLQRLAPDWHRKQYRAANKKRANSNLLLQRTVIISDQRAIARRLIFILASFLPGSTGLDGLHKVSEDSMLSGHFSTSSPSSHVARNESLRRAANRRVRDNRLQSSVNDKSLLSTSASSVESVGPLSTKERMDHYLVRKNSEGIPNYATALQVPETDHVRKTSAGTTSTITPVPATPIAYFSAKHDSYFPDGVVANYHDGTASADLAKILRSNSSSAAGSSNVSSRWGSLMSGISDLWTAKEPYAGITRVSPRTPKSHAVRQRSSITFQKDSEFSKSLQKMEHELESDQQTQRSRNYSSRRTPDVTTPEDLAEQLRSPAAVPQMTVDDKDGVIDVDLDIPGFTTFRPDDNVASPSRRSHRQSVASGADGTESIRSLRTMPTASHKSPVLEDTSVAGYLRRFHEDFVLHAARPYPELEEEIRYSMSREPSPMVDQLNQIEAQPPDGWIPVCSTLIADLRSFSLRRITLKRKLSADTEQKSNQALTLPSLQAIEKGSRKSPSKPQELFVVEDVKDFDIVLADAVERVLNVTELLQPAALKSPRIGHSRTASTGTTMTAKSTPPGISAADPNIVQFSPDYSRQDCRHLVMGALEEVAKDVNEDLSKLQRGRDIQGTRNFDVAAVNAEMKQENILREGVKRWLLTVEQTKVW